MSAKEDKSRRTENATPKKLRDARKRGQVIRSKEAVSSASILAIFAFVYLTWDSQLQRLQDILLVPSDVSATGFGAALLEITKNLMQQTLMIFGPLILLVIAVIIIANVGQFGLIFSGDPIKPQLSRINPAEGFKRIYSQKTLIELVKSVVKIVLITVGAVIVLRAMLGAMIRIPYCDIDCALVVLASTLKQVALIWATVFIVFSIIDYFVEKAQYLKDQRMTREEVKRERKDMEGDPFIKARRKQLHRQVATVSSSGVANASVIVNGPDMAVALFYEAGKTPLPEIVAVGRNLASERLRAVGRENAVPSVDDTELATTLLKKGQAGQYIPTEAIDATAAVLKRLKGGMG